MAAPGGVWVDTGRSESKQLFARIFVHFIRLTCRSFHWMVLEQCCSKCWKKWKKGKWIFKYILLFHNGNRKMLFILEKNVGRKQEKYCIKFCGVWVLIFVSFMFSRKTTIFVLSERDWGERPCSKHWKWLRDVIL